MQVGDLVKYIPFYDVTCSRNLYGIVVKYCDDEGCYTVAWNDGSYDEDLVHSELEVI